MLFAVLWTQVFFQAPGELQGGNCARPGIALKALLSEASSGGRSVYVLTIFGNANQRGQWLSSGWEKTIPDL